MVFLLTITLSIGCAAGSDFLNTKLVEAEADVFEDSSSGQLERKISETFVTDIDPSWIRKTLIVSPDNRRVAYVIREDNSWSIIIDRKKQKKYDALITLGGGEIVFNEPRKLHYLVLKSRSIYLVEKRF